MAGGAASGAAAPPSWVLTVGTEGNGVVSFPSAPLDEGVTELRGKVFAVLSVEVITTSDPLAAFSLGPEDISGCTEGKVKRDHYYLTAKRRNSFCCEVDLPMIVGYFPVKTYKQKCKLSILRPIIESPRGEKNELGWAFVTDSLSSTCCRLVMPAPLTTGVAAK
jgi:hypothetical protein